MDKIEQIYIINLKHRTDRLQHILKELEKVEIDKNKIQIVEAIYEPELGALWCAKSHLLTVQKFISSNYKNCLVLEDDFTFTKEREYIDKKLNDIMDNLDWDIIMLSGGIVETIDNNNYGFLKAKKIHTTSGYLINKDFSKILLENFKESVMGLQNFFNKFTLILDEYKKKLIKIEEEQTKLRYYKIKKEVNFEIPIKPKINDIPEYDEYVLDNLWTKI